MRTDSKSWLLLCVLPLWLNAPASSVAQGNWQGHTDWELKPGDGRSLASGEWFAPISQSTNGLLFSNLGLSGEIDQYEAREIALGIGYRHLYEKWIWGGYAFVERRDSADGNAFNQLSFGLEALSNSWDARINGYLPDPESKRLPRLDQIDLTNPLVAVRLGQERALPGFDVELGRRVAMMRDSRVYGGAFYFFDTDNFDGNHGTRLRFETRFHDLGVIGLGSRLTLGAEVSHDSAREFRIAASLRLRLPFGSTRRQRSPRLSSLERRMLDPVIRGLDDITAQGHSDPIRAFIYNSVTGMPSDLGVLNADDSGHVHNIVASARDHSVFFVTGAVRNSEAIAVGEGQSFFGRLPDQSISVSFFEPDGAVGQLNFMPEGEPGSIHGDDPAEDVFRVPTNVSVANVFEYLTISGGLDGIGVPDEAGAGDNQARVAVRNSVIENVAGHAISIGDLSNLELDGVRIRKTGGHGIVANSENRISVSNSTISETAMAGLVLRNRNRVTLTNTTINGTGIACEGNDEDALCGAGLTAGSGNVIDAQGLDIVDAAWRGINLGAGNDVTVADATVNNVGYEGVAASGGDNALRFTGVTIADAGMASNQEGMQVTGHGNEIILTDVAISRTTNDGIRITGSDEEGASPNTVIFTDVRVSDTRDDGIQIDDNNDVTMTDIHVFNLGGDGLHFGNANDIELNGFEIRDASGGVGLRLGDRNSVAIDSGATLARNSINGTGIACEGNDEDALCGAGLTAGSGNVIDAQGLDIVDAAWRGINLGAGNDVTVADATVNNVGYEGVAASGGDNALRFTGVTIADAGMASNQEGMQVTGHGNEIILTDVAISRTTNDGIRITGSDEEGASPNTVIFTDVRVSDTRDDGIQIDDNNGVFLTDVRVSDVGGDGIEIGHGNYVLLDGFDIRHTGSNGFSLGDGNNVMIDPGTTIERNFIEDTGRACTLGDGSRCGAGFTLGSGNEIDIEDMEIVNSAWRGMDLRGGNDVTMTHVEIHSVGYEGVAASGGDNALRFTGVTIANAGTTSNQEGIQVTGHGNEIVLTDVAVSGTTNDGIRITGSDEEGASPNTVIFTDVRVSDTRDDGIQIDDNNHVIMTDTHVFNLGGDGLHFGNGNIIELNGFEIRNAMDGVGLRLTDDNRVVVGSSSSLARNTIDEIGSACESTGGGIQCGAGLAVGNGNAIEAQNLDVINVAWRGLSLGASNDVSVTDASVRNVGYEGVAASGGDNALRFTGVTIANVGTTSNQEGIQVTGHSNTITLVDSTISGATSDGIRITGSNTAGPNATNTLILTNVTISDIRDDGDGIHLDSNNKLTLKDSTFKDIDGRTILVRHSGNALTDQGANSVDILDCSIHSDTIGIIEFDPLPDTEPTVAGRCEP